MFSKISKTMLFSIIVFTLLLSGCGGQQVEETQGVDRQQEWYMHYQKYPFFTFSLERSVATQLYIARNEARNTFTYVMGMMGNIVFSCPSKGFPLPYGVQITNSERWFQGSVTLPQPEPNGLFSTGITTDATWFLCNRKKGVAAAYSELQLLATSFPLKEIDGRLYDIEEADSSFTIDTSRPKDIPMEVPGLPSDTLVR